MVLLAWPLEGKEPGSTAHTMDRKKYVDTVLNKLPPDNLHLNTEIVGVSWNEGGGVTLEEASGTRHLYDHVILA